jgi:hypothetical protein
MVSLRGDVGAIGTGAANIIKDSLARELINKDLVSFLEKANTDFPIGAPKDLGNYYTELKGALSTFGDFDGTDARVFFRKGLLNFSGLASRLGRIANFYAGYGHNDSAGAGAATDPDQDAWLLNMKKFVTL